MFVEKLTEKDLKKYFKKMAKKDYSKVEEINSNFLKENNLNTETSFIHIPKVFSNIENIHKQNNIFCGFYLNEIKDNKNCICAVFNVVKFYYCSWTSSYILDETNVVMNVNDFAIDFIPMYYSLKNNLDWQKYLYKKFGEEYLDTLKQHLQKQAEEELNNKREHLEYKNKKHIDEIIK